MPTKVIPFFYTSILAVILVNLLPKQEIRRLFIYGLIFGGVFDIIVVAIGILLGEFKYINYGPYGQFGIHFIAPIAWTIFFIIYFYLLPRQKWYRYIYGTVTIIYCMLFCQLLTRLGVLKLTHGIINSIIPFVIWIPTATWGYIRLIAWEHQREKRNS